MIDKVALLCIKDKKILMAKSRGKDVYYIPGGKRQGQETDAETLVREIKEELNVELLPESIKHYGVFEAQAHGKPLGTVVRMSCYMSEFKGEIEPSSEMQDIAYYDYRQRDIVGPVDQLIFDDLKSNGIIN